MLFCLLSAASLVAAKDDDEKKIDGLVIGIALGTTYSCVGICPRIQMEMNTIWSWYVQSYAGRLAVVLHVGVLVGFVTMIINQIIKRISTTNISSDYFMGSGTQRGSSVQKVAAEVLVGHDEVYPLRDGVQGELDDETPSKEGNLSCDVASRLSKAAITESQENASKSSTPAVCKSTAGDENSLRKDDRLRFPGKQGTSSSTL